MTTHELANILLKQEDVPVRFQYFDGGNFDYDTNAVDNIVEYNGVVYLIEGDTLFPPEERYDDYEGEWITAQSENDEWSLYDIEPNVLSHQERIDFLIGKKVTVGESSIVNGRQIQ